MDAAFTLPLIHTQLNDPPPQKNSCKPSSRCCPPGPSPSARPRSWRRAATRSRRRYRTAWICGGGRFCDIIYIYVCIHIRINHAQRIPHLHTYKNEKNTGRRRRHPPSSSGRRFVVVSVGIIGRSGAPAPSPVPRDGRDAGVYVYVYMQLYET